jgi:putative Mn2+ efflux pump MntP
MSRRVWEIGGLIAGIVLVAFGAVAIVMGFGGRSTVQDKLKAEQIVGSPDMTPKAIAAEAKAAGLPATIVLPTCTVAGKPVNDGDSAKCFADYMRIHALEATGGQTYAQMGRYVDASGKATNVPAAAAKDPKTGQPVANPAREVWIQETALATSLDVAYMAGQLALFGIVVGFALLLSGIGFIVLSLGGALRRAAATAPAAAAAATPVSPAPAS